MKTALLAMVLSGCSGLGYVKVEFAGRRDAQQACHFDDRREAAVCVDIMSYLVEFDEQLSRMSAEDKQALLFERDWSTGINCQPTSYGWVCEEP